MVNKREEELMATAKAGISDQTNLYEDIGRQIEKWQGSCTKDEDYQRAVIVGAVGLMAARVMTVYNMPLQSFSDIIGFAAERFEGLTDEELH